MIESRMLMVSDQRRVDAEPGRVSAALLAANTSLSIPLDGIASVTRSEPGVGASSHVLCRTVGALVVRLLES